MSANELYLELSCCLFWRVNRDIAQAPPHRSARSPWHGVEQLVSASRGELSATVCPHQHSLPFSVPAKSKFSELQCSMHCWLETLPE